MKQPKNWKEIDKLKFFPTGNNWKKVLLEIYNNSPHSYGESHKLNFNEDDHPLAKKLKLTGYELMLSISFLRSNELIEDSHSKEPLDHMNINPNWNNSIYLTKKGFEVAIKLENELSNEKTQSVIVIFTAIIAINGFMGFFFEKVEDNLGKVFIALIYGSLVLIILFTYHFNKILKKFRRLRYNQFLKKGGRVVV